MALEDYAKHNNGNSFVAPTIPAIPKRLVSATIMEETNRRYDTAMQKFQLYTTTETALKQQLLEATPTDTFITLEDEVFGLRTVTTRTMIQYLTDQYPQMTPDDLSQNEAKLLEPWDPVTPIGTMFTRLIITQRNAKNSTIPISDAKVMHAALQHITHANVLEWEYKAWRASPDSGKTLKTLIEFFTTADNERVRQPKPAPTTYQGANAAKATTTAATTTAVTKTSKEKPKLQYCWTHGFTTNPKHTSATCNKRKPDHKSEATADNTMEGSTFIWNNKQRPPPAKTE